MHEQINVKYMTCYVLVYGIHREQFLIYIRGTSDCLDRDSDKE